MFYLFRAIIYNLKESYELVNQLKKILKDKTKTRADFMPIIEKLSAKLKVLHLDHNSLVDIIYPNTEEKHFYMESYCPEYKQWQRMILIHESAEKKGEKEAD